jgi:hypothetical protein
MSREETFKTPLSVIKRRWYLTWWCVAWLIMWLMHSFFPFLFDHDTWGMYLFNWFCIWGACWFGLHSTTWMLSIGMYFVGAFLAGGPAFQEWLAAGGHPFWDFIYWFNTDPPQVRAAIGVPPQQPYCFNCGASLAGMFGLGGNFGNVCSNCGVCNDTFAEGDCRPASFMGGG